MWRHIRCDVPSPRSKGFQSSGLPRANLEGKNPIAAAVSLTGADDVGLSISGPGMQRSPFWGNRTIPPGNGLHLAGSLLVSGLANVLVRLLRGDPAPPSGSRERNAPEAGCRRSRQYPFEARSSGDPKPRRQTSSGGKSDEFSHVSQSGGEGKIFLDAGTAQRRLAESEERNGRAGELGGLWQRRGTLGNGECVREKRGGRGVRPPWFRCGLGGGAPPSFHGGGLELPLWGARTCCFPIGGRLLHGVNLTSQAALMTLLTVCM